MAGGVRATTKVYATSDKKKLKTGSKTYEYGTISIRDARLTKFIGQTVVVTVRPAKNSEKGAEPS